MHPVVSLTLLLLFAAARSALAEPAQPQRAAAAQARPAASAKGVLAIDARLGGDEMRTRLVVDLTRKVELSAFTLADPFRVIVDLPNVTFDLPVNAGQRGRGLVTSYRYGQFAPGKARIVLDAAAPVAIDKAFVLDEADGQPARLVIDLVRTHRDAVKNTTAASRPAAVLAPKTMDRPSQAAAGLPVIVIDPGHGGIDSGALSAHGALEKSVVLSFARRLRDRLERNRTYRVVLTRSDDVFVPLGDRVKIARANQASLFISIHADALSRHEGEAQGATLYTLSETASDGQAANLADKENKSDLIAGLDLSAQPDDVANILFDLAQRETKNFSASFARTLVDAMKPAARMHKMPIKAAGFKVLRAPDVPSVLVELGYLSNKDDLRQMTSEAWQDKVADAMAKAVDAFLAGKAVANGALARAKE